LRGERKIEAHIEEAIKAGHDPEQARRSFGSILHRREESHGIRAAGWLESILADANFSQRRLRRSRVTLMAAVFSLGLGKGSCAAVFRLIDALLWRPLRVARLFAAICLGRRPALPAQRGSKACSTLAGFHPAAGGGQAHHDPS
jgi:hypothetical protein